MRNPVTSAILAISLAAITPEDARRMCSTFGIPVGHDHATTCDNILAATESGKSIHAVCYVDFVRPSAEVQDYRERMYRVKYEQGRGDADQIKVDLLDKTAPEYAPAPAPVPAKANPVKVPPVKATKVAKSKAKAKSPVKSKAKATIPIKFA